MYEQQNECQTPQPAVRLVTVVSTLLLVDFYEEWAEAAPGEGHEEQAAEWKATLDS